MAYYRSTSVAAIRASLFKSMEITFYETLKNIVKLVMTDEHDPLKALVNMLLSSMSSTMNLINLEDSQPMWVLVVEFVVASANWKNSVAVILPAR